MQRWVPGIDRALMMRWRGSSGSSAESDAVAAPRARAPGKRSWTESLLLQRRATERRSPDAREALESVVDGPGERLPFLDVIQKAFGGHDVTGVKAHLDAPARKAAAEIGAEGFATGQHVAFAGTPDLHTSAHEAAHVIQQRGGLQLKGGLGEEGDPYERHADLVADAVVRGESVEGILESVSTHSAPALSDEPRQVQRKRWFAGSVDRAKQELAASDGVPERAHRSEGGVETLAQGRYRVWGFPVDSSEPPAGLEPVLAELAQLYSQDPKSRVRIEGHTSTSGNERHNEALATLRAQRIMSLLLFRGLSPSRIDMVGKGERQPLGPERGNALLMARNRRVELTYEGEFPSVALDPAPSTDRASVDARASGPGLGCADARSQAQMLRVHLEAWVAYSGGRGSATARGNKDPGFDADRIAPDYLTIKNAASAHGYHQPWQWQFFVEQIYLPAGANLNNHLIELRRSIGQSMAVAREPHVTCDPSMPLVVQPIDLGASEGPRQRSIGPEPNSKAPGGQRY